MRSRSTFRVLSLAALIGATIGGGPSTASADDGGKRLRYQRGERHAATRRGDVPAPPAALARSPVKSAEQTQTKAGAVTTRPPIGAPRRQHDLYGLAKEAAYWTAHDWALDRAGHDYYRVGFWSGMRESLADPSLGRWDFLQGRQRGRIDPEAFGRGDAMGREAAHDLAPAEARRAVEQQFLDLSHEPQYRPRTRPAEYVPGPVEVAAPELQLVFDDFPASGYPIISRGYATHMAGWDHDPWRLSGCEDYETLYNGGWTDGAAAFEHWLERSGSSGFYGRVLGPDERQVFRGLFLRAYAVQIDRFYSRWLHAAWEGGFSDGWSYGSFVHAEWDYRQGYYEGFAESLSESALAGFHSGWRQTYPRAYDEAFAAWSENPKPQIRSAELRDGNEDGVFEPGEPVTVRYELVNYGGRDGHLPISLHGSVLSVPGEGEVLLPARQVVSGHQALGARISGRTPSRTRGNLTLAVAGETRPLSLYVTRPLQLVRGGLVSRRDNLAGRVTLQLDVENLSSRTIEGQIELTATTRPDLRATRPLPAMGGAGVRPVEFRLDGFDPLDLVGGRVRVTVTVLAEGVVQDRFEQRLAGSATDLASRDLPILLARQAHDRGASPHDVALARDLLLERLRTDWRAAARARGNPYKQDYKHRTTRTALGDLVQLSRRESASAARPDVFDGLGPEVAALSHELPGVHPFLRKYMRRLASRLP